MDKEPMQNEMIRQNRKFARHAWGKLTTIALRGLEELTSRYSLSVSSGDLLLIDGICHSFGAPASREAESVCRYQRTACRQVLRPGQGSLDVQGHRLSQSQLQGVRRFRRRGSI